MKTPDTPTGRAAATAVDPALVPAGVQAARYAALVRDVDGLVRKAADDCLQFDSSPLSFSAFKREQGAGR